jgi:hypothetical protein
MSVASILSLGSGAIASSLLGFALDRGYAPVDRGCDAAAAG